MTDTTSRRSPWATLNEPTLFSLDVNIVSHMNNSLDPMVLLWVERTHVLQTNIGSVRSEEQRVQLDCKKIYGKVETVRLWRSMVGKLVLLWVTFNAIEAVCHCTSSNFGASWWCCGRSVVKSVQEELTSEPFWDLFIEKESIRRSLVDIFACTPAKTLLLTLFGLVSGCIETETLSHHRETCFFLKFRELALAATSVGPWDVRVNVTGWWLWWSKWSVRCMLMLVEPKNRVNKHVGSLQGWMFDFVRIASFIVWLDMLKSC